MYVNPLYAERELGVLHEMIEDARFGLLVLCAGGPAGGSAGGPLAAHIPFVLRREEGPNGTLLAHVARIDPLARHLGEAQEALAIFSGPKAYVSPQWYQGEGLPTYNFLAVHAYGRPRLLEDRDEVLAYLVELVDVHEQRFSSPWSLASAAEDHVDELLPHIVAFTLEIEAIQGKRKLSQNKTPEDRDGVIRGLRARASDPTSDNQEAIAAAMIAQAPRD